MSQQIGERDFSKKAIKTLAKKGIKIYGLQACEAFEGDKYFTGTSYQVNDNGTGRILSFSEVLKLAEESTRPVQWDKPVINLD